MISNRSPYLEEGSTWRSFRRIRTNEGDQGKTVGHREKVDLRRASFNVPMTTTPRLDREKGVRETEDDLLGWRTKQEERAGASEKNVRRTGRSGDVEEAGHNRLQTTRSVNNTKADCGRG